MTEDQNKALLPMRAIERTFSVLDCFTNERPSLSLRQIAEQIKLTDATALRLVRSLVGLGYLIREPSQRYCLSLRILQLANAVKATLGIREVAQEVMQSVVEQTGETVVLHMRDGDQRVLIDFIAPDSGITGIVRIGDRAPLVVGAGSKVLLSNIPFEEQEAILERSRALTPTSPRALRSELLRIREAGFATSEAEVMAGTYSIAAPIFDRHNQVQYAMGSFGPIQRLKSRVDELTAALVKASATVSRAMGAPLPSLISSAKADVKAVGGKTPSAKLVRGSEIAAESKPRTTRRKSAAA